MGWFHRHVWKVIDSRVEPPSISKLGEGTTARGSVADSLLDLLREHTIVTYECRACGSTKPMKKHKHHYTCTECKGRTCRRCMTAVGEHKAKCMLHAAQCHE